MLEWISYTTGTLLEELTVVRKSPWVPFWNDVIGLSKKRPLWSKAWSRSENNVLKKYALLSLRYARGGAG